jgi:hypothetical protein
MMRSNAPDYVNFNMTVVEIVNEGATSISEGACSSLISASDAKWYFSQWWGKPWTVGENGKAIFTLKPKSRYTNPEPTSRPRERPMDLKDTYEVEAVRQKGAFSRDIIYSAGGNPASKKGAIVWSCGK